MVARVQGRPRPAPATVPVHGSKEMEEGTFQVKDIACSPAKAGANQRGPLHGLSYTFSNWREWSCKKPCESRLKPTA